jgi:hypothetical protein
MWQLPELVGMVIDPNGIAPDSMSAPFGSDAVQFGSAENPVDLPEALPIPVAPEVC